MSEHAVHSAPDPHSPAADPAAVHVPGTSAEAFDREDVSGFRADDAEAASTIGKMLVAFFFYSLLVMAVVTWWACNVSRAPLDITPGESHTQDSEDLEYQ